MTSILGISAFYHDSAASLVIDGQIVAAAQEERFSRKKHDASFPIQAIEWCLREAGISAAQIDHVGFYEKPLLKFDRLLETYLSYAPAGYRSFVKAMPQWLSQKLHLRREIRRGLQQQYRGRICFCEHHQSHAASAFFPSPFRQAAILTMDGVGEWATTSLGFGSDNQIKLSHEIRFPHSIGLLYSAFTYYTGFRVNSGEYKLMGLAPYGQPKYVDAILEHLIDLREDGSFRLNMDYFNYCQGLTMTSKRFHRLFGRCPRRAESTIESLDMDLAASIQVVTEQVVLKTANWLHRQTSAKNLCMAGGVALNCVANGRLLKEGPFEHIWVQPAAGDAGGALGAAMFIWHQLLDRPRTPLPSDAQHGSLLGPRFDEASIREAIEAKGCVSERISSKDRLYEQVADALADGKVVGWMRGRMEFGPRALGSRSILGDPRSREMQSKMNLKIKFRESFRPFAPAILADDADAYFELPSSASSPYMLMVFGVQPNRRLSAPDDASGLDRVHQARSDIPAVTHVDYSARVQTVDHDHHPELEELLRTFKEKTGCPLLINTSFNVRGEPIVCTPENAIDCFLATNMDLLVIEDFLLDKEQQQNAPVHDVDQHLARFQLD